MRKRHNSGQGVQIDHTMEYQVTEFNRVVSAMFESRDLKIRDLDEGIPSGRVFQAEGTARAKALRQEHAW